MKFFEFIFLKRRLENDKDNIIQNLETSKKRGRPMWLVLFPEGTGNTYFKGPSFRPKYIDGFTLIVISDDTRLKSKEFADKLQRVKRDKTFVINMC